MPVANAAALPTYQLSSRAHAIRDGGSTNHRNLDKGPAGHLEAIPNKLDALHRIREIQIGYSISFLNLNSRLRAQQRCCESVGPVLCWSYASVVKIAPKTLSAKVSAKV